MSKISRVVSILFICLITLYASNASVFGQATQLTQLLTPADLTPGGTTVTYPEAVGTYHPSPYTRTVGANTLTFTNQNTGNSFYRVNNCQPQVQCGWMGDYAANTPLLYSLASPYLDIAFAVPVGEVGFRAEASAFGPQTLRIEAFNGTTSLGSFTANDTSTGDANDTAAFLGVRATGGNSVTKVRVTVVSFTEPGSLEFFTVGPITWSLPGNQVAKIQYRSGTNFVDTNGILYVLKGTTVAFKAIPSSGTFPAGKPVWGGTAGITGTGATKSANFPTISSSASDFFTVTAESGNTVTVNVIVYELQGILTPQDNFADRSQTRYGIAELIDLNYETTPALTTSQIGELTWEKVSGDGIISNIGSGTGVFTAADTPGTVGLKLTLNSGPSTPRGRTVTRQIIIPSGGYIRRKPGTTLGHTQGQCTVIFTGEAFLLPKTVSFSRIQFREGNGTGIGTGYFAPLDGSVHPEGAIFAVTNCNRTTGCYAFEDLIGPTEGPPPFSVGDFLWPIEWQYLTADSPINFFIANHHQTSDATGRCTIEKAGAGPFAKNANAPSS